MLLVVMLKLINSNYFFMKKIILGVVGLLLVAGGVHAYGKVSGKKSLQILNGPWGGQVDDSDDLNDPGDLDDLDEPKEDDVGCCLPQCGKSSKAVCEGLAGREWVKGSCENRDECKLGCCQFDCKVEEQMAHDACNKLAGEWNLGECEVGCCRVDVRVVETMPYKTCSDCTGGSWSEGQIYASFLEDAGSNEFGGNQTNWEMKISLKACGNDPVTANWTGAWEWVWVVEFPDGTHKADHSGNITSFTPDSGGRGSFSIKGMDAQVKVSKSNMHIVYPMGGLGDIVLDGPIIKE